MIFIFVRDNPIKFNYLPVNDETTIRPLSFKEKLLTLWDHFKIVVVDKYGYFVAIHCTFGSMYYYNLTSYWGGPYLQSVFPNFRYETVLISLSIGLCIGPFLLPVLSEVANTRKWVSFCSTFVEITISIFFVIMDYKLNYFALYILFIVMASISAGISTIDLALLKNIIDLELFSSYLGYLNLIINLGPAIAQELTGMILKTTEKVDDKYTRWLSESNLDSNFSCQFSFIIWTILSS